MHLLVVNGPNLNLLGTREPSIYGTSTLAELEESWRLHATRRDINLSAIQSNHEGDLIDAIQGAAGNTDGIILNAGALTHTSRAIPDAIAATGIPTVEVHISNIHEREAWRATSFVTPVAEHVIYGRGTTGYINAIDHLIAIIQSPPATYTYGDLPDQVVDVRQPNTPDPSPIVVLLHGGFWREVWTRDIMDPVAVSFASHATTFNVEYRRGSNTFPESVDDVNLAIDWIVENAHSLGCSTAAITVVGHSAGGYLALKVAERRADVSRVVALAAAADLDALLEQYGDDDPASIYLGGSPATQPGLWSAAKLRRTPRVPVTVIHGADDEIVPATHSTWYADTEGVDITSNVLPETDHFDVVDPLADAFRHVAAAVRSD